MHRVYWFYRRVLRGKNASMSRIFISYRRDDSLGHVGWLRSLLIRRFGADQIFRDIETIPPGVDFVEAIEATVGSCDVLLAVIGPRWLTTTDRPGLRRLDNPEDFVRIEIATALERNIRVIPVQVQDAHMPRSNELPTHIARLARWSAIELRDSSWEYDVGRLADALESILQSQARKNLSMQLTKPMNILITHLLYAEEQKFWDIVIAVGEQILKLDPNHQSTRSKTAFAYYERWFSYLADGGAFSSFLWKSVALLREDEDKYNKYLTARQDLKRAAQLGHDEARKEVAVF